MNVRGAATGGSLTPKSNMYKTMESLVEQKTD
jgi:hypothetical protein